MGAHIDPESQVVLFLIFNLLIGFVCYEINKRTKIPFTPLLVACGVLLRGSNIFQEQSSVVEKLNPHAILVIFIPLLIFESAFSSHIESLFKLKFQVFFLAIPGTIMTIFMLGFSFKELLGYDDNDVSWSSALLLGTILSTTDIVAVVAILKSLGAPLHIQSLIENESLFNDFPAIIFFTLLVEASSGLEVTIENAIKDVFSLSLGGVGIGLAFSFGCMIIIKFIMKGKHSGYLNIAIISAYGLFFVCEKYGLKVSGLIALVILGLNYNITMKDQISHHFKEQLHTCVQLIETTLFFVAGTFMGSILFSVDTRIDSMDWMKMILFYLCLVVSRGIVILILYYPLKKTGEGFDYKKAIVVSWGGLRGALSVALALIVHVDDRISQRTRDLIIFNVVGVAFLTLVLNGSSFGPLLTFLKIKDIKDERTQFKGQVLSELQKQSRSILEVLKYDQSYKLVEWKGTEQLIQMQELDNEIKKLEQQMKESFQKYMAQDLTTLNKQAYENKVLQISRYQVIRVISKKVKEIQDKNWISKKIFDHIYESLELLTEECFKPINSWNHLNQHLLPLELLKLLQRFEKTPIIGTICNMYIHYKLEIIYEMAYIVQYAFSQTIKHYKEFKDLPQQIKDFPHLQDKIMDELNQQVVQAKQIIEEVSMKFWPIIGKLQQRKAVQSILMKQTKIIDQFIKTTYVPEKEGQELKRQLTQKIEKLSSFFSFYSLNAKTDSIFRSAFKNYFNDEELQGLMQNAQDCTFQPQQYITQYGEVEEFIYIITSGKIERTIYRVDHNITQFSEIRKSFNDTSFVSNKSLADSPDKTRCESPSKPNINPQSNYNLEKTNFHSQNSLNLLQPINDLQSKISQNNSPKKGSEKKDKKVEFIGLIDEHVLNKNSSHSQLVGLGSMIGVLNIFGEQKESVIDIKAIEITTCKKISISYLRQVFQNNLKFQEYVYKKNLYQFFHMFPSKIGQKLIELGEDQVIKLAIESQFVHLKSDQDNYSAEEGITCKYGGFVFSGKLSSQGQNYIYSDWQTIPCTKMLLYPMCETKLIIFKPTNKIQKKAFADSSENQFQFDSFYASMTNLKDEEEPIIREQLSIQEVKYSKNPKDRFLKGTKRMELRQSKRTSSSILKRASMDQLDQFQI